MSWYCYLLASTDGQRTYIGATIDPDRRLQQHNGQKAGGAAATRGRQWRRVALVSHFPDDTAALQFEWAWKFRSRRRGKGKAARLLGLLDVLQSPQATSKARPFAEWPLQPHVWIDETLVALTGAEKVEGLRAWRGGDVGSSELPTSSPSSSLPSSTASSASSNSNAADHEHLLPPSQPTEVCPLALQQTCGQDAP